MRRLAGILLVMFIACGAASGDVPRPASFEELFGLSQASAKRVLGDDAANCLLEAVDDFNAALAGREALHARPVAYYGDGGTANYRGRCYSLTVRNQIFGFRNGEKCVAAHLAGPVLVLDLKGEWASREDTISRTRLIGTDSVKCFKGFPALQVTFP